MGDAIEKLLEVEPDFKGNLTRGLGSCSEALKNTKSCAIPKENEIAVFLKLHSTVSNSGLVDTEKGGSCRLRVWSWYCKEAKDPR